MKTNFLTALAVIFVGCLIGYKTSFTTVNANSTPKIIPRFVEVPKPIGFDLNIDLKKESVEMKKSTDEQVKVIIQKKDSIVYKYKTSIVEKKIPMYVRVSPNYSHIKSSSSVLPKNITIPSTEKITLKN